jgi:hypothetical protein
MAAIGLGDAAAFAAHSRPRDLDRQAWCDRRGWPALPDTLPGRMETVELWPFSQGEIDRTTDGFVDAAFALGPDLHHESTVIRAAYADRIVRGGLPEAVARGDPAAEADSSTPTCKT